MDIIIRREKSDDIGEIHDVTVSAFLDAPHTDHTEQFVVKALRDSGALTVSLVAEQEGELVGHVALSPVNISDGACNWYGLGPISVLPKYQGNGIGSKLMHAVISELEKLKGNGCVLLGDPNYYHRFGFEPIKDLVLADVPPEYFQALLVKGEFPQGTVVYHEAFSAQG
ncbi:MAG: N-acetyltransferase [Gammaproteobacteria bacterium]|nr:N-acetyltransferase [Gammaproteobacteria bacterium]